ncbi:MAG: ATP-binding protein, partial [Acidobacteriota bacterium]
LCQVRDRHGGTEIVVADNGLGIPKTELTKVFDSFYRLRRDVDSRRTGSGLGLTIVRGLVEELRGRVRAVSGDGEPGTRFEIHLPQADPELAAEATRRPPEPPA